MTQRIFAGSNVKWSPSMRMVYIYSLFWPVLMFLAIANGFLREAIYGQFLSELRSHQLSTVLAMALLGFSVALLSRYCLPGSALQAAVIGLIWLLLLAWVTCLPYIAYECRRSAW